MKHIKLYESFDIQETWIDDDPLNIEKGDKILINSKLKDYIKKYNWPSEMNKLIGKTFEIYKITSSYDVGSSFDMKGYSNYIPLTFSDEWFIPEDCAEKILDESFDFEETWIDEPDEDNLNYKFVQSNINDLVYLVQEYINENESILYKDQIYKEKDLKIITHKITGHELFLVINNKTRFIKFDKVLSPQYISFGSLSNDIQKLIYKSYNL